jgi:hypothetical protein
VPGETPCNSLPRATTGGENRHPNRMPALPPSPRLPQARHQPWGACPRALVPRDPMQRENRRPSEATRPNVHPFLTQPAPCLRPHRPPGAGVGRKSVARPALGLLTRGTPCNVSQPLAAAERRQSGVSSHDGLSPHTAHETQLKEAYPVPAPADDDLTVGPGARPTTLRQLHPSRPAPCAP